MQQQVNITNELRKRQEAERIANLESKEIAEGSSAEMFINQPFWKVLVRDLDIEKGKLLEALKNPHMNMTKEQIKVLQIRISDIELFIKSPNKYLDSLRELRRRKMKRI